MNKSQRASETQPITNKKKSITPRQIATHRVDYDSILQHVGNERHVLRSLIELNALKKDPSKRLTSLPAIEWIKKLSLIHDIQQRSAIGVPSFTDDCTSQYEAPGDIPTIPLAGYQWVKRVCQVEKLATTGSTAGGFYTELIASDLAPFHNAATPFRVSCVTSWTAARGIYDSNTCFAGVSVPAQSGSSGTEIMPAWAENWTQMGRGFSGIMTKFPLGDFPLYAASETATVILRHFTALGGTGGISGVPVVFHVTIECLI